MAFKDPVKIPQTPTTADFINKSNPSDLSGLSLNELADRYEQIERQGQLFQGLILLEVRNHFKSDNDLGDWVKENSRLTLCSTTPQHRSRLMNLARFFKDRDMTGISITAAYEISAPSNSDIADEIYSHALLKNLSVAEVKQQIALKKGTIQTTFKDEPITPIKTTVTKTDDEIVQKAVEIMNESVKNETIKIEIDLKSQLMAVAKTVSPQVAIVALQACIQELNTLRYPTK